MGLTIVVLSYAGRISISITSCREIIPDPDCFCAMLRTSLKDLEAGVRDLEVSPPVILSEVTPAAEFPGSGEMEPSSDALERLRRASRELDEAIETLEEQASE